MDWWVKLKDNQSLQRTVWVCDWARNVEDLSWKGLDAKSYDMVKCWDLLQGCWLWVYWHIGMKKAIYQRAATILAANSCVLAKDLEMKGSRETLIECAGNMGLMNYSGGQHWTWMRNECQKYYVKGWQLLKEHRQTARIEYWEGSSMWRKWKRGGNVSQGGLNWRTNSHRKIVIVNWMKLTWASARMDVGCGKKFARAWNCSIGEDYRFWSAYIVV